MEKKNYQSVFQEQDQYRLRMLQHSGILKMKSRTLFAMALSQDFKLGCRILMISFQHTLVNSLLLLVFLVPVKVDFVDQMVVGYNNNYGWKTAFASPENQPTYLHAHKLMRKTWQGMPTKEDIGGDRWNQIADHCNSNYFHIDMERYTLESVLRKGAELVKA